ncbi:MAG TPA: tetratricopeptide repeat protein [Blastocatellia bacterium]
MSIEAEHGIAVTATPWNLSRLTAVLTTRRFAMAALAALTVGVYWQVYGFQFTTYDDGAYVTDNIRVQGGVTGPNLLWALHANVSANWHPVTLISHMLDCQFFGLWPGGHHVTSLAIHIINVLLLFWVLQLMTGMVLRSAFVAALFAIHPLNVESVAWIAERKNVLSTMLFLLAIWAYIWYTRSPNWKRYLAFAVLFALGLMSKPMLVTFPFVLLLLDYWPLGRMKVPRLRIAAFDEIAPPAGLARATAPHESSLGNLILEKVPLVLMSIGSSFATVQAQKAGHALESTEVFSLGVRISNAIVSYLSYVEKAIWPTRLAVFYPHPFGAIPIWQVALSAAALGVITGLAVISLLRIKFLAIGWLWYVGTLVPVIGLVQVGGQSRADRYAYIPLIGLFIVLVWGMAELGKLTSFSRSRLAIVGICVVLTLAAIAAHQVRYWHDSTSLFEHADNVTKNNYMAWGILGGQYTAAGRLDQALFEYARAMELDPGNASVQHGYGRALKRAGQLDQAIVHLREAVRLDPQSYDAYNELGISLAESGNLDEAAGCFGHILQLRPSDAHALANLGNLSEQKGDISGAIQYYRQAVQAIASDSALGDRNAAMAMASQLNMRIAYLTANGQRKDASSIGAPH